MATPTHIENKLKNINIDGVENCNLLCKLIIDYLPTSNCIIQKGSKNPSPVSQSGACDSSSLRTQNAYSYIDLPAGSFINYRDTSYEATRVVFFRPSRHMIDNERFDFEVNIYHGTFFDNDEGKTRKGIVSHAHYKADSKAHNTFNNKYHYHTNQTDDNNHDENYSPESKNNMVSCILFNIDDHKGTNSNVFFNQFININ